MDTSGLYALVDKSDSHHAGARTALSKILRAGRALVVTDYVVTESVNLANARSGSMVAARILDLVDQSVGIRIEWIGTARFDSTKTFFRKHADQGYSFTDCTSFVVMRELRMLQALTTDRHFTAAGFEALLRTRN